MIALVHSLLRKAADHRLHTPESLSRLRALFRIVNSLSNVVLLQALVACLIRRGEQQVSLWLHVARQSSTSVAH